MGIIIKFEDCIDNDNTTLEISVEDDNRICICIENVDSDLLDSCWLDIETAVKFSKELRRQISIAKDNESKSEDNE